MVGVDDLALSSDEVAEGEVGETVEVAMDAAAVLVQQRDGVACEELLGGTGDLESMCAGPA